MTDQKRNMPLTGVRVTPAIKEALRTQAQAQHRSLNSQVTAILEVVLDGSLEQAAYERGLLAGLRQSDLLG